MISIMDGSSASCVNVWQRQTKNATSVTCQEKYFWKFSLNQHMHILGCFVWFPWWKQFHSAHRRNDFSANHHLIKAALYFSINLDVLRIDKGANSLLHWTMGWSFHYGCVCYILVLCPGKIFTGRRGTMVSAHRTPRLLIHSFTNSRDLFIPGLYFS